MRIWALALAILISVLGIFIGPEFPANADSTRTPVETSRRSACSCSDAGSLNDRLRGVEAVIREIASQPGPPNRAVFDAGVFDERLGDAILRAQAKGGIRAMVIGDIDRSDCSITTGASLGNMPGVPAGLGGSACLIESVTTQLDVRRQACQAAQAPANQGNDYWEGRPMAEVIRELNSAYTAEANFLRQQISRLAATCRSGNPRPVPTPPKNICQSCVQYLFEGQRSLPVVGTIRMSANEIINFTVAADNTIAGTDTINTALDTSGSPCTITGYNGVADIEISGELLGGYVNAVIKPKGASQRTSAHMKITCPPEGKAEAFPVQQTYEIRESLKIPLRGQRYTEKRIDLSTQTMGAMEGYIILRLFVTPR